MVIQTRKYVKIEVAEKLIRESRKIGEAEAVKRLRSLPRRQPAPPPPEGGICLREAGRKYGLHHTTLLKWVRKGILPILKRTPNWLYVDESIIKKIMNNGGRKANTT